MACDTYQFGKKENGEFLHLTRCLGNGYVKVTANGKKLEGNFEQAFQEFQKLPEAERKPAALQAPPAVDKLVRTPSSPPAPPAGGLVARAFCRYVNPEAGGEWKRVVYDELPPFKIRNIETQMDSLWFTEAEWKSFFPASPQAGASLEMPGHLQERIFCTVGIDFHGGSISSLDTIRSREMKLTVDKVTSEFCLMRLNGLARLGKEFPKDPAAEKAERGCDVRLLGFLNYNYAKKTIDRFDVVGLGEVWAGKWQAQIEKQSGRPRQHYGLAYELVTTRDPIDCTPPYNMLAYSKRFYKNGYFAQK